MLASFDVKSIGQDKKRRRNGKACRASPTCFRSSLTNLMLKDTKDFFYLPFIISRFNGEKIAKHMKSRHSYVRTC